MAVPLLDLSRQFANLKDELNNAVLKVVEHGRFILGPEVVELEQQIATLCGVKHARGVASGTDALLLALSACGVGHDDEVITTDFSFFATAGVIDRLGAKPVLVDIEPDSYNIDPNLIEAAITDKTKAIVPVHLYGQVADMDPILEIGKKHNLMIVEDAAQAIGAEYKGRKAGSMGDVSCFSFYPSKNLGAGGDGGIIVTDDDNLAHLLTLLRNHGAEPKYYHKIIGFNSRLATIQAALLLVKLPHLQNWTEKRIAHAKIYNDAFSSIDNIITPKVMHYSTFHIYNQYTISITAREKLIEEFKKASIGFDIYYPVPFHKQECFIHLGYDPNDLPNTNKAADTVISLPIYPEMTDEEQQEVIDTVLKVVS
jgi:dTDP-4-amino-4,6-dideoxygalactose transaminase